MVNSVSEVLYEAVCLSCTILLLLFSCKLDLVVYYFA